MSLVCIAFYSYVYLHSAGAVHSIDQEATILSVCMALQWSTAEPDLKLYLLAPNPVLFYVTVLSNQFVKCTMEV